MRGLCTDSLPEGLDLLPCLSSLTQDVRTLFLSYIGVLTTYEATQAHAPSLTYDI